MLRLGADFAPGCGAAEGFCLTPGPREARLLLVESEKEESMGCRIAERRPDVTGTCPLAVAVCPAIGGGGAS